MTRNTSHSNSLDLFRIARQTMIDAGFVPDFPGAVIEEVNSIVSGSVAIAAHSSAQDLRELLWSSIDDKRSRDLDQVEYAEKISGGDVRLLVGIADVDAVVPKESAIDKHAATNCISVYTGIKTFPMLPEELSTDLTSLVEAEDRIAVVTEMLLAADGSMKRTDFQRAIIRNHAKLSYESVGAWLDGKAPIPERVTSVPGLEAQVKLQSAIANRLEEFRRKRGAIDLETIQTTPVVNDRGKVVDLDVIEPNRSEERR